MRLVLGALACLLAAPAGADGPWRVTLETPAEVVAIDLSSVERRAEGTRFRERLTFRGGQTDPYSLRPLREVLAKRQIDCPGQRIATLSRAVFSDHDALIEHQAVHPDQAPWQIISMDDPTFKLVCERS